MFFFWHFLGFTESRSFCFPRNIISTRYLKKYILYDILICIGSGGRFSTSFAWDRWQDSQKSLETSPQFHLNWTHPQLWGNVLGRLVKAGIKAATGTRISYPTHLFCSRPIPLRQRHRLRRRGYPRRHGQVLQLRKSSSHVFTNSVTTNLRKNITNFYLLTFLRGEIFDWDQAMEETAK